MRQNYFIISWRILKKNRISTALNILGISLAIGCALVAISFVDSSLNQNGFLSKRDKLYVLERMDADGQFYGSSPEAMGPMLLADYSQIKNMTRINYINDGLLYKVGSKVLRSETSFVDDSFFDMLDYDLKWGSVSGFEDNPNGIVLTEELSQWFFKEDNSVGKTINIRLVNNDIEYVELFEVMAVLKKRPISASFYFTSLIHYGRLESFGYDTSNDWSENIGITFLEIESKKDLNSIRLQQDKYLDLYNTAHLKEEISAFHFQRLDGMLLHAKDVEERKFGNQHIAGLIMIFSIALAIMLMVCLNYLNIALASSSSRLKEISVRKVLGSSQRQIIVQFLVENLIVCFIGTLLGIVLARVVFLPWFSEMSGLGSSFSDYFVVEPRTYFALFAVFAFMVIGGAAYPALYISRLNPVAIFNNETVLGSKNAFRKALIGFQFVITMMAIILTLSVKMESGKMQEKSWGYANDNTVVINLDKKSDYTVLKDKLLQNSIVKNVSGAAQQFGSFHTEFLVTINGDEDKIEGLELTPGFITERQIDIVSGRDLSIEFKNDTESNVLVNRAFTNYMGWDNAVGKSIIIENVPCIIVGETANFHSQQFSEAIVPMIFKGIEPVHANYMYAEVDESASGVPPHIQIEKIWQALYIDLPFNYFYQDQVFEQFFRNFAQIGSVLSGTSLITLILAIMGLFGFSLLVLDKKMKEISIKKVLGASHKTIVYILIKEFICALLIACFVAIPLGFWLSNVVVGLLNPSGSANPFALVVTVFALILMIILSVSWHAYKALTVNPVEYLRDE